MKKYLVEGIGTFFLVLTIALTAVYGGTGALAPVAIGAILMIMIYAGGPISGGHFNPSVTLAAFLRGACPAKDVAPYMIVQILGGIVACVVARFITGGSASPISPSTVPVLIAEFLFTFALAYVVLHVATSKVSAGNSYFGFAIGGTVMVGAFAVGSISGGSFNPAVSISLLFMGVLPLSSIWVYLLANLAGGAAAAFVYKAVTDEN